MKRSIKMYADGTESGRSYSTSQTVVICRRSCAPSGRRIKPLNLYGHQHYQEPTRRQGGDRWLITISEGENAKCIRSAQM